MTWYCDDEDSASMQALIGVFSDFSEQLVGDLKAGRLNHQAD